MATKRDLDVLEFKLEAALHRELRAQTYRMLGFFTAAMAVVVAAVKI